MVIEVMVAAAIITVSVLATMAVAQKSVHVSRQAFHTAQASFLLEEGAEVVRIFRDNNTWVDFTTIFNNSLPYFLPENVSSWVSSLPTSSSGNSVGIFTREIVSTAVYRDNITNDIVSSGGTLDPGTRLFTVTVSWQEGGATVTKTLQFYITDFFS